MIKWCKHCCSLKIVANMFFLKHATETSFLISIGVLVLVYALRNEYNEIMILCLTNLCDASWRWHWIFVFIFRTFEARTPANITGLGFATNWPLRRVSRQKSCFKSQRNELFGSRGGRSNKRQNRSKSSCREQILNKTKDFFESLKYYLRM